MNRLAKCVALLVALGLSTSASFAQQPTPHAVPLTAVDICAKPGSTVVLPSGASPNMIEFVSDCAPKADASPQPLSVPITVLASKDATIAGAASYRLTLTGQSVGFRKNTAGPWWMPF